MMRFTLASVDSGFTATVSGIATQFGLATMPFFAWCSCSGFTSGTTSGQSGSMRHAEELSTTIAPAFAAIGEYSLLTEPGVLLNTICTPANASGRSGSTVYGFPANSTVLPALFSEARNLIDLTGKLRSASTFRIRSPTAPVAPTTATFTDTATPQRLEKGRESAPKERIRIPL